MPVSSIISRMKRQGGEEGGEGGRRRASNLNRVVSRSEKYRERRRGIDESEANEIPSPASSLGATESGLVRVGVARPWDKERVITGGIGVIV